MRREVENSAECGETAEFLDDGERLRRFVSLRHDSGKNGGT
jgi:hypothetical protein